MLFNDRVVKSLKPKDQTYTTTEANSQRGVGRFQVKVYPSGTKHFQMQYFSAGRRRFKKIGVYGSMTLSEARTQFREMSQLLVNNESPASMVPLVQMLREYLADQKLQRKLRPYRSLEGSFDKNIFPFIDDTIAGRDFTLEMGVDLVRRICDRGSLYMAERVRSDLSAAVRWAISQDNNPKNAGGFKYGLTANVFRDIPSVVQGSRRVTRFLSEKEIKAFWHAEPYQLENVHLFLRLNLSLAGQRIHEVYWSRWDEYKDDYLVIPESRCKIAGRGNHIVPITDYTREILEEIRERSWDSDFLFPHRDSLEKPGSFGGVDSFCRRFCLAEKFDQFTPRDVRRTCKTLMSKAKVDPFIRDLLQQHFPKDVSWEHYNQYDYFDEKKRGLEKWQRFLRRAIC